MRTAFILFIALLSFSQAVVAQKAEKKEYEDLWVLFIDEDFEKLAKKAISITENKDRRKEPMPYLFASMAYYELSKDEEKAEDYPKAFKDANKYAAKWRKKDKKGETVYDNKDYISELRGACMEVAENYLEEGAFSKAKGYYKYMVTYGPDCPGSWLMYGYALLKMNDFSGSKEAMAKFDEKVGDIDGLEKEQKRLLKYGLITYAEHQFQEGERSAAVTTMEIGEEYFKDDKEYSIVLEDIKR